jgi:hypothetical protein
MTADAYVLNSFSGETWDAEIYGSLLIASQLAAMFRTRAQTLKLIWFLRQLNRKLNDMLAHIYAAMEGKPIPLVAPDGLTEEQRIVKVWHSLRELHRVLDRVYQAGRRAGWINSTFTATTFVTLRKHDEAVLDLIQWVETLREPQELEALFERAAREARTEDAFDLSTVS